MKRKSMLLPGRLLAAAAATPLAAAAARSVHLVSVSRYISGRLEPSRPPPLPYVHRLLFLLCRHAIATPSVCPD